MMTRDMSSFIEKQSSQTNFIALFKKHRIPRLVGKEISEQYFDFSKMYDTIFHDILLDRIRLKRKLGG